jgi:hypothetical protein
LVWLAKLAIIFIFYAFGNILLLLRKQIRTIMAVLTMFYGVIISMYYFDNRQHHFPHIHVRCQDMEAVVKIPEGEIIEGELPAGKNKLLQAWIELHKDELMADWDLASNGTNVFQIEPLK